MTPPPLALHSNCLSSCLFVCRGYKDNNSCSASNGEFIWQNSRSLRRTFDVETTARQMQRPGSVSRVTIKKVSKTLACRRQVFRLASSITIITTITTMFIMVIITTINIIIVYISTHFISFRSISLPVNKCLLFYMLIPTLNIILSYLVPKIKQIPCLLHRKTIVLCLWVNYQKPSIWCQLPFKLRGIQSSVCSTQQHP